jgi:hypothetical protein
MMKYIRIALLAIWALALAACGLRTSQSPAPSQATAVVSAQPTVAAAPIQVSGQPAPQPTAPIIDAQPQPVIGFQPQSGGPGTSVNVFGSGYAPNEMVAIRLGLPQPLGEALASAQADAAGRWSTQLVIPDRLPSGTVITGEQMRLVAMNDRNEALASAPFAFTKPSDLPPPAAAATDAVAAFLMAVQQAGASPAARSYLTNDLRAAVERGEFDIHTLLIEQNPFTGFTVDSFTEHQSPNMPYPIVQVTLQYGQPQPAAVRHFSMVQEQGQWKIGAVAAPEQPGQDPQEHNVRDTIATFITLLNTGKYQDAAALFGGDYQPLRDMNPDISGDLSSNSNLQGQLLERACTANGFACFQQRRIVGLRQIDRADYLVEVEFNNPDGSLFTLPASGRSSFQLRVQRLGGQLVVMDLPPYAS